MHFTKYNKATNHQEGTQNLFTYQELVENQHFKPNGIVSMKISTYGGKDGDVRNLEKAPISIETERKERN